MPRANRHFIPGQIWHITHRCHQRDFLLKLQKDRQSWMSWLYEAKLRHGITFFNYVVTSNHIHLLLFDDCGHGTIPKAIQLIASRTAQEYDHRKVRKGAFWEDWKRGRFTDAVREKALEPHYSTKNYEA